MIYGTKQQQQKQQKHHYHHHHHHHLNSVNFLLDTINCLVYCSLLNVSLNQPLSLLNYLRNEFNKQGCIVREVIRSLGT